VQSITVRRKVIAVVDPAAEQFATVEDIAGTAGVANIAALLNDADEPEYNFHFLK
jgi:hypothetical protein